MQTVHHDKLVRDLIPEVIRAAGKTPVCRTIPAADMLSALDAKLSEEVREYQESHCIEEMADILEVLHGIAFHMQIPWDDIENERLSKRTERGGFEKGICLIEVRSE